MPTPSHQALLLRVLAWHNRHPLARRIKASQVHSIGEVLLPFASAQAQPDVAEPTEFSLVSSFGLALAAPTPALPPTVEAEAEAEAVAEVVAEPEAPLTAVQTEPSALATAQGEGESEGEAAIDMPTLDIELSESPPAETSAAEPAASLAEDPPATSLDPASAAPAATEPASPDEATIALPKPASGALTPSPPTRAKPAARAAPAAPDSPPGAPTDAPTDAPAEPASRVGKLQRWLAAIGLRRRARAAPMQPLFSRSIVWPLSAAAIARWTQRHGQPLPLLPADEKHRRVEVDPRKQAAATAKGLPQLLHLHVLSASIVDGDRRMRVLMSPTGAVLGSRAYSRPRQATASALLMIGMLGAGLGLGGWWQQSSDADGAQGLLAALSAAPQAAASDAVAAAAPAASSAASAEAHTEPRTEADHAGAGHAAASAPTASAVDPVQAEVVSAAAATAAPAATTSAAASATPLAAAAAPAASDASLARVRPQLSEQDKRLAREQSARMLADEQAAARQAQAAAKQANAPVYALVSPPSLQRDEAQRSLKLMQAAFKRLQPPAPAQAELVQNQGLWRAAWWPFGSRAEAERARVLLSGRGQRVEVVEF